MRLKKIQNEDYGSEAIIFVQGDTLSALIGAILARYRGIKIFHIEAGLRSNSLTSPFPEEIIRKIITLLAHFHFAPSADSFQFLVNKGKSAYYTKGNTFIDSIKEIEYIKNGNINSNLQFYFDGNPNLQYICADDENINQIQQLINAYGYTNCHINSYCSFIPGGTFYEISGNTKFDLNNNGCDVSDINYPNLKFNITNGTVTGSLISNSSGNYTVPVQVGNYTITPNLENPSYFNVFPTSFSVDFSTQASPFSQDFCVTANGVHSDVEIVLIPTSPARPGFDASFTFFNSLTKSCMDF
jgi:hypothetical protein